MTGMSITATKILGACILAALFTALATIPPSSYAQTDTDSFITTWRTTTPNESITIPVGGYAGSYNIDWGDGTIEKDVAGDRTHRYENPGNHTVSISGNFTRISLGGNDANAAKIISIDQWGDTQWSSMALAFFGAENMAYKATDAPDLSQVTDMSLMFYGSSFNGNISEWDVSSATDMSLMFSRSSFRQNLGAWYVVPNNTIIDRGDAPGTVGAISSQNAFLDRQYHSYGIGTGGDSTLFNITGSDLVLDAVPTKQTYTVNVTSTGAFGTNNHRILQISITGDINNPPTADAGPDPTYEPVDVLIYGYNDGAGLITADYITLLESRGYEVGTSNDMVSAEQMRGADVVVGRSLNVQDAEARKALTEYVHGGGRLMLLPNTVYATCGSTEEPCWYDFTKDAFGFRFDGNVQYGTILPASGSERHLIWHSPNMLSGLSDWCCDAYVAEIADAQNVKVLATVSGQSYKHGTFTAVRNVPAIVVNDNPAWNGGMAVGSGLHMVMGWREPDMRMFDNLIKFMVSDIGSADAKMFVTTWKTTAPNASITLPVGGATGTYTVDWGDGTIEEDITGDQTHRYENSGQHTVSISSNFTRIYLGSDIENAQKIVSVDQWGNSQWTNMAKAFQHASNMIYNALDEPDITRVTDMGHMFSGASSFNGDISEWDVSQVTDMGHMFSGASSFNGDISEWDVSQVTDMGHMFSGASSFNGDISEWDVSQVTDMGHMFSGASSFNQNLGAWYVVPNSTIIDRGDAPGTVGAISSQNAFLDRQYHSYGIGTGGDSTLFNITGSDLVLDAVPTKQTYTVNVTSTGAFGTNNHRILQISITGDINNPPTADAGPDLTIPKGSVLGQIWAN